MIENNKKIYCKDCKWRNATEYGAVEYDTCYHPSCAIRENSAITETFSYKIYCQEKNRNNDCKDFEDKWIIKLIKIFKIKH